ncbi:TetR family transcriptional regulator, partial [Escherichia coli]|nr:TetR family transcriptional regulator [Escherichia coli]
MTGENRGRGRPRKTESTYADTRNDLIRSGLELLTQNGFLATGVDAIVKNANVPKGSLKWSTKTGHRVRVFSSIDFPIRLVVT